MMVTYSHWELRGCLYCLFSISSVRSPAYRVYSAHPQSLRYHLHNRLDVLPHLFWACQCLYTAIDPPSHVRLVVMITGLNLSCLQCTLIFRVASTVHRRWFWVCLTLCPLTCGAWAASWQSCTRDTHCTLARMKWNNWPASWRYSECLLHPFWTRPRGVDFSSVTQSVFEKKCDTCVCVLTRAFWWLLLRWCLKEN